MHEKLAPPGSCHPDEIAFPLASLPQPRINHTHGRGYRYTVGGTPERPHGELDVFPEAGLVRYASEGFGLLLESPLAPYAEAGRVIFHGESEHGYASLTVDDEGGIVFVASPRPHPDPEIEAGTQAVRQLVADAVPVIESVATAQPKPPESNTNPPPEKQPRVEKTGRVGHDLRLRHTKTGITIAKFPLAEHASPEDGGEEITTWVTVVTFKALKVCETVKKGDKVKVIGYQTDRPTQHGTVRNEINAVVVKPLRQPPAQASS